MSIDFASKEDRSAFKEALAIEVKWDIGNMNAKESMSKMQEQMGEHTKVTVNAQQVGGHPGKLSAILGNDNKIECSLLQIDKCITAFNQILQYARTDFKEQLKDKYALSPIR